MYPIVSDRMRYNILISMYPIVSDRMRHDILTSKPRVVIWVSVPEILINDGGFLGRLQYAPDACVCRCGGVGRPLRSCVVELTRQGREGSVGSFRGGFRYLNIQNRILCNKLQSWFNYNCTMWGFSLSANTKPNPFAINQILYWNLKSIHFINIRKEY